ARRGAGAARRGAAVAGTLPFAADAGAVPRGTTGGRARGLSGRAPRADGRARPRAERGAARTAARDPGAGPFARSSRGGGGGARARSTNGDGPLLRPRRLHASGSGSRSGGLPAADLALLRARARTDRPARRHD